MADYYFTGYSLIFFNNGDHYYRFVSLVSLPGFAILLNVLDLLINKSCVLYLQIHLEASNIGNLIIDGCLPTFISSYNHLMYSLMLLFNIVGTKVCPWSTVGLGYFLNSSYKLSNLQYIQELQFSVKISTENIAASVKPSNRLVSSTTHKIIISLIVYDVGLVCNVKEKR